MSRGWNCRVVTRHFLVSIVLFSGCILEIKDTGKEIAPLHLAKVIEAFYRVDASRSHTEGKPSFRGIYVVIALATILVLSSIVSRILTPAFASAQDYLDLRYALLFRHLLILPGLKNNIHPYSYC
ncbi:hypothetical protein [Paenibacillus sp.]|uniref:hypothetical protein n=1 Tax=Paenibacillus sp. TaxID=58172 RepID=UPI0028A78C0F|nr:hypothetical protein [Paenibacillus sp.]